MSEWHAFHVICHGRRRGLINGALVCSVCDYDHTHATVIPNERYAKDVRADITHWLPERNRGA